jgi:hypothetical protein
VIRLLLLAYPASWRRRYGAELAELVNDVGLGPRVAVDLVRGGLAQRLRQATAILSGGANVVIGPAWRHPTAWAVAAGIIVIPTGLFITGSLLAYGLESPAMRPVMDEIAAALAEWRAIDAFLVLAPAVALLAAVAPLLRLERRAGEGGVEAVIGVRLRLANLAVTGVALALAAVLAWYFVGEVLLGAGA